MIEWCGRIVDSALFHRVILGLILLATALVGLETYPSVVERWGDMLHMLDRLIIYAFVVEALLKMARHGRRFDRYFHDPWNVFDFIIVVLCFVPSSGPFAAVGRLARAFRVLRMATAIPRLQLLVGALLKSMPSMVYVGLLLSILFYIYAVIGVFLWRDNDPVHFGSLQISLLSLFQIVTLEDWTDIMYIQMLGSDVYPYLNTTDMAVTPAARPILAALYFTSFVLFGTMIVLNLFIGVIIKSMEEAQLERERELRARHIEALGQATVADDVLELEHELESLTRRLAEIRSRVLRQERAGR